MSRSLFADMYTREHAFLRAWLKGGYRLPCINGPILPRSRAQIAGEVDGRGVYGYVGMCMLVLGKKDGLSWGRGREWKR